MTACLQYNQMFCSRDYQLTSRFNQQNEKPTSNSFFNLSFPSFTFLFFLDRWIHWGGGSMTLMKEEEDVNTSWSWIKVGGSPAQPEEEAERLLVEVGLLYPFFFLFMWLFFCSATPMFSFWSFFAGVGVAEVDQLIRWGDLQTGRGSPVLRRASENGSSSGQFRDRGFLWASEGSDITLFPAHILTSP